MCKMQVSPPGLHITLGIFYRLWSLLEEECHLLDLQLAQNISSKPEDRELFSSYSGLVKELAELERKRPELSKNVEILQNGMTSMALLIPNCDANPIFQALQREACSTSQQLDNLVSRTTCSVCIQIMWQPWLPNTNRVKKWEKKVRNNSYLLYTIIQDNKICLIKEKCKEGFPLEDGPFVRELDAALASINIHREAYYGGAFTGNHAHKCLQVSV